jgi:hypothetical protein
MPWTRFHNGCLYHSSVGCENPMIPHGSITRGKSTAIGAEVTHSCYYPEFLRGPAKRTCGPLGWSPSSEPECEGNVCSPDSLRIFCESRLPPTAVRMNHERLPRHGLYRATSSMTSRCQIWHILNICSGQIFNNFERNILIAIDFPCKLVVNWG